MDAADTVVSTLTLGIAAEASSARFSRRAFSELWPLSVGFTINQPFAYIAPPAGFWMAAGMAPAGIQISALNGKFIPGGMTPTIVPRASPIRIVFPAMARVQGDRERLRTALLKSLSLVALLTLPTTAFCVVFAKEVVGLLLGPQWGAAVGPFAILSGALYLRLAWRVCAAVFQARGRPNRLTDIHVFRAVALVLGVWFAQPTVWKRLRLPSWPYWRSPRRSCSSS
jgi:PST family polysaccharide transporter